MNTAIVHDATIRQATEADIEQILAFRAGMFRDCNSADEAAIAATLPLFAGWLRGQMALPDRVATFLKEVDGAPVACAVVWVHEWYPTIHDPTGRRAYILNVYTRPDYRRQGIAGQLVQACLGWLAERNIRNVSLHASRFGESVYRQLGFHPPGFAEMVLTLP